MKKLITILVLVIVMSSVNGQNNFTIEHEILAAPEKQTTLIFRSWIPAVRIFLRLKRAEMPRKLEAVKVGMHKWEYQIKLKKDDFKRYMPRSERPVIPMNIQLRIK